MSMGPHRCNQLCPHYRERPARRASEPNTYQQLIKELDQLRAANETLRADAMAMAGLLVYVSSPGINDGVNNWPDHWFCSACCEEAKGSESDIEHAPGCLAVKYAPDAIATTKAGG